MKIGLLKSKSLYYKSLKQLAEIEGFEFDEVSKSKAENYDLIFSVAEPCGKMCVCFSELKGKEIFRHKNNVVATSENNVVYFEVDILKDFDNAFNLRNLFRYDSVYLDYMRKYFVDAVDYLAKNNNAVILTKWYFPVAKKACAVITHDIDDLDAYKNLFSKLSPEFINSLPFFMKRVLSSYMWRRYGKKRYAYFPLMLSFDRLYGFKPTIFLRSKSFQKEENGDLPPNGSGR
ncbi:MAG: hypothetical protein PHW96_04715, partial [Candidatus Nanoarchaeia archaeon]|nr:hypothetical protein [Candidatus Nanoarchaeia archaeon]